MQSQKKSFDDFLEDSDFNVIENAFKRAARIISPDLARTYAEHLASKNKSQATEEEALMEAHTDIAAMGLIADLQIYLDAEAEKLTAEWLDKYRVKIKDLTDDRQEAYRVIRSWSKDPQSIDLVAPTSWMVPTTAREESGKEIPLPAYKDHLLCDKESKLFPCELKGWELAVLNKEIARSDFGFWYRNPSYSGQDSLGIAYSFENKFSIVRPDFLFFSHASGKVAVDIVDPHGTHLSDSMPKLQGLAQYAEAHGKHYRRIEAVAEVNGKFRVLDLQEADVRDAIMKADSSKSLYEGNLANDY